MDSYVDRELESPLLPLAEGSHNILRTDMFSRMLLASIVLHVAITAYLMRPGSGAPTAQIPIFDLSSITLPQEPKAEPLTPQAEQVATAAQPEEVLPPPTAREELTQSLQQALNNSQATPEILQQTSLGFGMSRGYFNSLAEGKTLRGDIREYYFDMLRRLNEVWWAHGVQNMPTGKREALVNLEISRDGILLGRYLARSTGDPQLDKAILGVIDAASPFPPLPQSYEERTFTAPLRLARPLNLLSFME